MSNLSLYSLSDTASTNAQVAKQRAAHFASLGIKDVIELCCGPSLQVLSQAYRYQGIRCVGNDIDPRYAVEEPLLGWKLGDCFDIEITEEMVVFAPPLSRGCSGKREDALSIFEVRPGYAQAVTHFKSKYLTLVLPGKTLSLKQDKSELYKLLSMCYESGWIPKYYPRIVGCTKYIDIVCEQQVTS